MYKRQGYEKGDSLLRHWSEAISEVIDEDGIVGRISRDNVVVLALFESEAVSYTHLRQQGFFCVKNLNKFSEG